MAEYDSCITWLLLGSTAILCLVSLWRKNRALPPGPRGLPLVGYYPFLGACPAITLRRYGGIMSFRTVGGTLIVVINDLGIAKEVLVSRYREFTGRPLEMNLLKWIDGGFGIAQIEGLVWKEQRRFFLQAAKDFGFAKISMEGHIQEMCRMMIDDLRKLANKPLDLMVHISHVTSNVISRILFQKHFRKEDPIFLDLVKSLFNLLTYFNGSKIFLAGPLFEITATKAIFSGRLSHKAREYLESVTDDIVTEHERTFDPKNIRDFVDAYLNHMRKLDEKGELKTSSFSRRRLLSVAMNMLMEGTESVSTSLRELLSGLSNHEEVQMKAQQEMDQVVGRNRLPSWLDKGDLPYLEAVILELFRKYTPFPISTYYSNFEETTIRGYRIPKRTCIVVNLSSVSSDPVLYPDPSKFDPARFLDENGNRGKREGPFPFGIGKRLCVADAYVKMEVFLIIAAMLQNFNIYPSTEGKVRLVPRPK